MKWLLAATLLVGILTFASVLITRSGPSRAGLAETGYYSCHETTMVNAQGQARGTLKLCGYGLIRNCETLEGGRC